MSKQCNCYNINTKSAHVGWLANSEIHAIWSVVDLLFCTQCVIDLDQLICGSTEPLLRQVWNITRIDLPLFLRQLPRWHLHQPSMEDGSAQALEVIISQSDQFGFFQKRTFIATSFLQAITISVLVYTCVATPEPSTDDPCTVASTNGAEPLNETFTSFNQTVSVASTNIAHTSKACSSTDTGSFIFILTLHVPKVMEDPSWVELYIVSSSEWRATNGT